MTDRDLPRAIVVGTALNSVGAAVGQAVTLIGISIAIHNVGSSAFAYVILGQSIAQWPLLLEKGVGYPVVRLAAVELDDRVRIELSSAVVLYGVLGVIVLVFGLVAGPIAIKLVGGLPQRLLRQGLLAFDLVILAGAVRAATAFVPRALVAQSRWAPVRANELVRDIVPVVGIVFLVNKSPSSVVTVGASYLVGEVAAAVLGLCLLWSRGRWSGVGLRSARRDEMRRHVRASGPIVTAGVLATGSSKLDPLIVGIALGPAAVATYALASRILEAVTGAQTVLTMGVGPTATRLLEQGSHERLRNLFRRVTSIGSTMCWPPAILIAAYGGLIVERTVGGDLPGIGFAIAGAMLVSGAGVVLLTSQWITIAADRVNETVMPTAVAVSLNLAVTIGLVRTLGVVAPFLGSAVDTIPTGACVTGIAASVAHTSRRRLLRDLRRPAILAGSFGGLVLLIRLTLSPGAPALIALLGASLLAGLAALAWVVPVRDLRRALARG